MAGKEIAVKKYVVRLTAEERAQLDELISKGKRSAQLLTKARILLKADVSDAGEGWSDSRIAAALDISIATIERTRRQLVEEGFDDSAGRQRGLCRQYGRRAGGLSEAARSAALQHEQGADEPGAKGSPHSGSAGRGDRSAGWTGE